MSRYIDADKLLKGYEDHELISTHLIWNAPSADVVEVRHGKWIDDEGQQILLKNAIDKGENWKVCSICGAGMCIGAKYKTDKAYHRFFSRYCPNCGARMDGEEQEHE